MTSVTTITYLLKLWSWLLIAWFLKYFFGRGLSSCTHEAYFLAQTSAN
jgi:hypothetical protein